MISLFRPDEKSETRHLLRRTLENLQSATARHSTACGCDLCHLRRKAARQLESLEPDEPEVYRLCVEKIERKISCQGGGA